MDKPKFISRARLNVDLADQNIHLINLIEFVHKLPAVTTGGFIDHQALWKPSASLEPMTADPPKK